MPLNYLTPIPTTLTPMANISPVTYRDGTNLMRELEFLKNRINETLIPEINGLLTGTFDDMAGALTDWNERWDTFMADIQAELAARNDAAIGDLIDTPGTATHDAFIALIDATAVTASELTTALGAYATTSSLNIGLGLKVPNSEKGVANGVATLGGDGKVPSGQLPAAPPTNQVGTYSTRPAANTLPAGTVYYATDVQETYRTTGTAWTVVGTGGNELGYAEIAGGAMTSTESTTGENVPGLTVAFIAGHRPVSIALSTRLANFQPNQTSYADILVDGTVRGTLEQLGIESDVWTSVYGETRVGGLTPGQTYTVTVRVRTQAPATSAARFSSEASLSVVNR